MRWIIAPDALQLKVVLKERASENIVCRADVRVEKYGCHECLEAVCESMTDLEVVAEVRAVSEQQEPLELQSVRQDRQVLVLHQRCTVSSEATCTTADTDVNARTDGCWFCTSAAR